MRMKTKAASVLLLTLFLAGCVPVKKDITENSQQETVATETPSSQVSQVPVVERVLGEQMSKYEEIDPSLDLPDGFLEKFYDFISRLEQYYIPLDKEVYLRRAEEREPGWEDPEGLAVEIHKEDQSVKLPDLYETALWHREREGKHAPSSWLKQYVDNGYALNQSKTMFYRKEHTYLMTLVFEKGDKQVGLVVSIPEEGSGFQEVYEVTRFVNENGEIL